MSEHHLHDSGARKPSDTSEARSRGSTLVDEPEPISPRGALTHALSDFKFSKHRDTDAESSRAASFFHREFANPFHRKKDKGDEIEEEQDEKEDLQHRVGLRLLHSSPEPLIDLIFVHGLKGHPVKTWRESGKPRSLWPQYWLPLDYGFHHVNVHTFGYEADVARGSSILNISDFGQTLLEEMRNSPYLRDNESGPIILLGHSLGGLVIKKAFISAGEVANFRGRIRTIFFLGTPHGGNDLAKTLSNVLTAVGSSRGYLKDLSSGSSAVQLINEEFGRRAHDMPIFSFFETGEMRLGGITSEIVVPKESAVLGPGFTNERVQYLNADHRGLVKFPHPNDDNYCKLKNALSGAVYDLLKDVTLLKQEEAKEQIRLLKTWLSMSDRSDEEHHKVEGSCQWLDDRDEFQDWRYSASNYQVSEKEQNPSKRPSIVWVHANPGTGKSVLAQHVVSELQQHKFECSYYYFHVGNKTSRSLSDFLRSIAFQMAMTNAAARQALLQLCQEGSSLNFEDDRTMWTRLFSKGIFQSKVIAPQFWVIDALDECGKYKDFFTMLKGEQPNFPLRIFITSRNVPGLQALHRPLEAAADVCTIEIPVSASMHDIQCYVRSRIDDLPLETEAEREELATTVLKRSDACFLWVRLVMDKLETVYSSESIMQILRELPEGMVPYYERTTQEMSEKRMEKDIAKAVLLWVVASSRRMTTSELASALKLDIKKTLTSDKTAIEGLCGQLVCVDVKTDTVNVVHPTAREFLLTKAAGEFHIERAVAHERIAMACFEVLKGPEMQPPRARRMVASRKTVDNPFLNYAITQFSEHIYGASAESDQILTSMDRFFKTNVLSWIERVARRGDLQLLIRTSRNLKAYLDRRAKYKSPLNKYVKNIDDWSTDLSRLVTKFGEALLNDPISIHFLIPPLCPSTSPIYTQFGKRPDGLVLAGFKSAIWDDCIASITFGEDDPIAVSCGKSTIAVSLASGGISLFNQQSCQKVGFLKTKWPVDLVRFTDDKVAVATIKTVLLMDLQGNKIWEKRIRSRFLYLTSYGKSIYAVAQNGHLLVFNMMDGTEERNESFEYRNHDVETDYNRVTHRAPAVASISPDMETLAMGFRGGTVCLWDIPSSEFIGWARDEDDWLPAKMMFNPNPNTKLLFIVYTNHRISLFDTSYGALIETRDPEVEKGVLSAACSHDGRTAVTTDAKGAIQIWDFETLNLLYHLDTPHSPQRILDFDSGGTSIVDVSTTGMRIWSPAALIRKNVEEDESISDDAPQLEAERVQYAPMRSTRISALCAHPTLPIVFAGTSKGKVFAFSTKTGKQLAQLYEHPHDDCITCIAVGKNGSIASSDDGTNTYAWKLEIGPGGAPRTTSRLLQVKRSVVVSQLCFSTSGEYLLISDALADSVYSVQGPAATLVGAQTFDAQERQAWKWIAVSDHPDRDTQFALVSDRILKRFSASAFPETIMGSGTRLEYELKEGDVEQDIAKFEFDTVTQTLILDIYQDSGHRSCIVTFLFDLKQSSPVSDQGYLKTLAPSYRFSNDFCGSFIGLSKKTRNFIFLDGNSWLSTLELNTFAEKSSYLQHFFVPNEYLPPRYEENGVRPVMTAEDDVVFCLYGELVVMKNGLKFQDEKSLDLQKHTIKEEEEDKSPA